MNDLEILQRFPESDLIRKAFPILFVPCSHPPLSWLEALKQAEAVLKQLGIPMATAIDMYLRQITLTGGIPFSLSLPERCALVESEPERTQGLRQMLVDNYSVFYLVGEDTVSVAHVLHSASDLMRRLRGMK